MITLSNYERKVLENQFRILHELTKDSGYLASAEILNHGYSSFYSHALGDSFRNECPMEIQKETMDILDMFRYISRAVEALPESQRNELDIEQLTFKWFDGNNDEHYGFLYFLVNTLNRYEEVTILNSHGRETLPRYKRMLSLFNGFQEKETPLSLEQLKILQSATNQK